MLSVEIKPHAKPICECSESLKSQYVTISIANQTGFADMTGNKQLK